MASVRTSKRAPRGVASAATERQRLRIGAFGEANRATVSALASAAPNLSDLSESFPALLFALATGYGREQDQSAALQLVLAGAPLRDVADALALPHWLRHLPAEAFTTALPDVPRDAAFSSRIADFLPQRPELAGPWLNRVLHAARAANPETALWIARLHRTQTPIMGEHSFRYLLAWAWHADQPGTAGHALLRRPWSPAMGLSRALEEVRVWQRRLALAVCLGSAPQQVWLDDGSALGYEIIALRTAAEFLAESVAMNNCLDQFADHMETGASRVFSIRRSGRPVADVEIGIRDRHVGVPTVLQVRATRNRLAGPEVWRAVYAWLGNQPLKMVVVERPDAAARKRERRRILAPYIDHLPPDLRPAFEETTALARAPAVTDRRRTLARLPINAPVT